MDVRRSLQVVTGLIAVSLIASLPIQAQDNKTERYQILAGPIGKSSSASARVTLVIPPRPKSTANNNTALDISAAKKQKKTTDAKSVK